MPQPIDYNALAAQARGAAAPPSGPIDYNALAAQARGGAAPTPRAPIPPPAAAPAGNTISQAPAPSEWARLKNTVANSAIGRSVESFSPKIASTLGITPTETVNSPTYQSDRQQILAPQYVRPSHYTPSTRSRVDNVVEGVNIGIGKLTSGDSLATGAALAATGGLAAPLAAAGTALKVAGAGMGAYGVGQSLYGANKAYSAGDTAGGDEQMGEGVPNAAMMLPLAWDGIKQLPTLPDRLIRQPLTTSTDLPLPGSSFTPRERYQSAQNVGASLDAADATGSPALGIVKKVNRDSLGGFTTYDKAAARNTAAVGDTVDAMLPEQSPLTTPSARGGANAGLLRSNQAGLKSSANTKFNTLDDMTGGAPIPGAGQVGEDARTLTANDAGFNAKYPSLTPTRAMRVLGDLGNVGDSAGYGELQRLRSNVHELTSTNDDLVKEQALQHLETMTGSLDSAITDKGLNPQQTSIFRDANGDWADMKEQYDNPSSPLYHAVRTMDPSTLDKGIGGNTPEMLANLRPRIGDAGIGNLARGNTETLLGRTSSDEPNFKTFSRKFYSQPAETRASLYGPEMNGRMNDVARTATTLAQDFNPSGSGKQAVKAGEAGAVGAGLFEGARMMGTGEPIAGAATAAAPMLYNAAQYGTARLMNSPRFVDWLMKQPGETPGSATPNWLPRGPIASQGETAADQAPPGTWTPGRWEPTPAPTYGTKEVEPGAVLPIVKPAKPTDSMGEPMIRPERPQQSPARPYEPQVARPSNIRDIPVLPEKTAKGVKPLEPLPLFNQAPQYNGPAEVKMQEAAAPLPAGPDLSHLNNSIPALDGSETKLRVPGEDEPMPARYRVIEADTVTPSHNAFTFKPNAEYPEGVQQRDYEHDHNEQMKVIDHAQKYEPDMTVNNDPTGAGGPPVVTPNGIALGGNSRVMSTQRLYGEDGKGGVNYKNYLMKKADQYGINPDDVAQMKKPMLVREVQSAPDTASLHQLGDRLNKGYTAALSTNQKAVSMGKDLSPDTIGYVRDLLADGGTLREAMGNANNTRGLLIRMQSDGVISNEERPQYVDSGTGGMNEAGKSLIEKALLGGVMGDSDTMDNAPRNVTAKLNSSIGPLSELASRPDAWNIIPQLRTAVKQHTTAAAAGNTIENHLNQNSLFGNPMTPVEEHLTRVLGQGPNAVRDAFSLYGKDARYAQPGQSTFLGPSPSDAFNHAFGAKLNPDQFAEIKPLAKK